MKLTWKLGLAVSILICGGGLLLLASNATDHGAEEDIPGRGIQALEPFGNVLAEMKNDGEREALDSMQKPPTKREIAVHEAFAGDPRLIALSIEEAAWLDRHHYPKAADLTEAESIDPRHLAGTRDPRLMTIAGSAFMKRGMNFRAMSSHLGAGTHGALYSYQQGAIAERALYEERFGPTDVDTAGVLRARLEVALVLGDHTTQYLLDTSMADVEAMASPRHVQSQAREFLRSIAEDARLQGLPPPTVDPRPNAAQWKDLYRLSRSGAAGDLVTVYERE